MRTHIIWSALLGIGLWCAPAWASDVLSTTGFSSCMANSNIKIQKLDVTYTRSTNEVVFDVAGTNEKEQNVTATLTVTAYGNQVYTKSFNPCGSSVHVPKLCPVPSGTFAAQGSLPIPSNYASNIPSIAFAIPDLQGRAKMVLKSEKTGADVACVESQLSNGKSMNLPAVSYVSAGIAGAALVLSGVSALSTSGHPGTPSSSPGFGDVMGWFHTMATNGMLSVNYPSVYHSFSKNFAWSTGLIPWSNMQNSIDSFRKGTGGNLTHNNYEYFLNASRASSNGSSSSGMFGKRGVDGIVPVADLVSRSIHSSFSSSTSSSSSSNSGSGGGTMSGIKTIAQELMIPASNTFMTVLLILAIVIAAIVVSILLVKVILELWAMYGSFPKKLTTFRKDYWGFMARTITSFIMIVYGIWVMYCVYQLSSGDSWAAKVLAAVTLAISTAILILFSWRIFHVARKYKKAEGDTSGLYENKDTWRKYSLFYDTYKKDFWWVFVPVIVYMFAKGCIIAGGNGHGLVQSGGQLIVEALMLTLLVWNRPYATKSCQWINITIQVVRVLSVACILTFVEELGLSQTTKTVTGIVLIAVQATLTGVLAILIAINGIIVCFCENPHVKRRKEAAKMNHLDDLTPLDARDSLLMEQPPKIDYAGMSKFNFTGPYQPYGDSRPDSTGSTDRLVYADYSAYGHGRGLSRDTQHSRHSFEGHLPTPAYGMAI